METPSNSLSKAGTVPKPRNETENDGIYLTKFEELQKYVPFLNGMIRKLEASKDKVRDAQLKKMKNLLGILTDKERRMKIDTLVRCEEVLKKLEEKLKLSIVPESPAPTKNIKTEAEDVVESPASPPQPDLTPLKFVPKIIPVERCATVERDFSKAEKEAESLEVSRGRLKGLMLKSEMTERNAPLPAPSTQIPGLDMMFTNQEESIYDRPSIVNSDVPSKSESIQRLSLPPETLMRDEWKHLESNLQSRSDTEGGLPRRRDIDERRHSKDIDDRTFRRDFDERQPQMKSEGVESRGMQTKSVMTHPPLFAPDLSKMASSRTALLPTPGFPNSTSALVSNSSSVDLQRSQDSRHKEIGAPMPLVPNIHSVSMQGNASLCSTVQPGLYNCSSTPSRHSTQREVYEKPPLLPTPKSFPGSVPRAEDFEHRNRSSIHSSSIRNSGPNSESGARSVREMIMQKIDKVEKLGVSSGGALRKLKSDICFSREEVAERDRGNRLVETTPINNDEGNQRSNDMVPRKSDPRLEREPRRSSLDDETQRMLIASRTVDSSPGYSSTVLPHNMPNFGGQNIAYGSAISTATQWNQSHIVPAGSRALYQGQHSVHTFQWQTTCTLKQTTAHDLGERYQPRSRHSRQRHNTHSERSMPSNSLKSSEETLLGHRDFHNQRRDADLSQISVKKPSDPRCLSSKIVEERKGLSDCRSSDLTCQRKDKPGDKGKEEFLSPLNSLYNEDKRIKTGPGYGLQSYKIPKRTRGKSPSKDFNKADLLLPSGPQTTTNRDPRLLRSMPRPPTPDPISDSVETSSISQQAEADILSQAVEDLNVRVTDNTTTQSDCTKPRSCSPSPEMTRGQVKVRDLSPSPSRGRSPSHSTAKSRGRSSSHSRAKSPGRSPSYHRGRSRGRNTSRHRVRSRSTSRGRSSLRTRSKSRGRSPKFRATSRERNTSSSRERSPSRSRAKSRTRSPSRSRDKSRSRDRSVSHMRAKSRGRSPSRSRNKSRSRDRSLTHSRAKSRGRSPCRSWDKSRSRDKSPTQTREKSRGRTPSRSQDKSRGRSRSESNCRLRQRSHSNSRDKSQDRSQSNSRDKSQGRSRERSTSRTRCRSRSRSTSRSRKKLNLSHSRSKSRLRSPKAKSGRSPSRSPSWGRTSSSRSRRRSRGRSGHRSRERSHSFDSDKLSSWKRKESPSPDRKHYSQNKKEERTRNRSASSGSTHSRNSVSHRSRGRSRSASKEKLRKLTESSKRSPSKESLKTAKKSSVSSRSSSGSGRSSPLFPKSRSQSNSPSRSLDFDSLLKKDSLLSEDIPVLKISSTDKNNIAPHSASSTCCQKDVVSSSHNVTENENKGGDNVMDVPTSTSEIISEISAKSDVGSSSEISSGSKLENAILLSSKQDATSVEPGNIIVGFLKSLVSQSNLIELAELAASQLPEEKRAKVLEIFKEGVRAGASVEDSCKGKIEEPVNTIDSKVHCVSSNVKVGKAKKKAKTKAGAMLDGSKKLETSAASTEKQPKEERKKKNELEKLHEDIREMFISNDVVTATGQRSCRMRKESKDMFPPPKSRPGSAEGKTKAVKNKNQEIVDSSDDSPPKGPTELTVGSSSECEPTEDLRKLRYSSESEDEMPMCKWRKVGGDSSGIHDKNRKKLNFLESGSESDIPVIDEDDPKLTSYTLPMVVLEKSSPDDGERKQTDVRSSRNVARRGRKQGAFSRDLTRVKVGVSTQSYDGDGDDEEEECKVEDKDMSQIDTSNIIQVEGLGNKLTRNQLKLLKGPELREGRQASKRSLNISKEISECESDTSKASESFTEKGGHCSFSSNYSSPSPVQKKRKLKKTSGWQKGTLKKRCNLKKDNEDLDDPLNEIVDSEARSLDQGDVKTSENFHDSQSIDLPPTHALPSSDIEMHELPLSSRLQNVSSQNIENKNLIVESTQKLSNYHEDLDYVVALGSDRVSCKICDFHGRGIVSHYVINHPTEEVLVSRFPKTLANSAKTEAVAFQKDLETLVTEYSVKKRTHLALRCLLCNEVFTNSKHLFEHVTSHTGEFRYSCSQCNFKGPFRSSIKSHRHKHNNASMKDLCCVVMMELPPPMKILFGYLCSECNYFQLLESNLTRHIKLFHSHQPSVHAIRVSLSQEILSSTERSSTKVEDSAEEEIIDGTDFESVGNESGTKRMRIDKLEDDIQDVSVSPEDINPAESSAYVKSEANTSVQSPSNLIGSSHKSPTSVDMSIFVGSEQPHEDDSQLQEERQKLLKDAGEKLKERPKIHLSISEKLAQRLQDEHLPSSSEVSDDKSSTLRKEGPPSTSSFCSPGGRTSFSPGKSSLRLNPARLVQKSSDGSEKRLTRSSSRTSVPSMESESIHFPKLVPEEVKAPLSASTLNDTLQRMQETIQTSMVLQSSSSVSSSNSLEISPHSQFTLKTGSVRIGLVEAKVLEGREGVLYNCLSAQCTFGTKQAFMFVNHIEKVHPPKPASAPCSGCEEDGNILRDMSSSFHHLIKYHLLPMNNKEHLKTSYPPAAVLLDSSQAPLTRKISLIRPRKLPGDVLSQTETSTSLEGVPNLLTNLGGGDLPSLVISSVVSLSKDHTPDGIPLENQSNLAQLPYLSFSNPEGKVERSPLNKITASVSKAKIVAQFKKHHDSLCKMLQPAKLCHLFKCMGQRCSFSTNMKEFFAEHYQKHLLKELQRSSNAASENYEWQKCCFCGESKDSGEDLADHILMQHSALKYQCSGCFYRAATVACVLFHQNKCHDANLKVLECCSLQGGHRATPFSSQSLSDYVKPYKCSQASRNSISGVCGMTFVSPDDFTSHLESNHLLDNLCYCSECGLGLDKPARLICHYSASHSYRMYHCLYCTKASETRDEISFHMCLDHQDQDMSVAARTCTSGIATETMKLSDRCLISVVNLGNVLKSGLCLQSYPKDGIEETDDTNDPISFDAEPLSPSSFSLPYASIEFGMHKASCLTQISSQSASTSIRSFGDGDSYESEQQLTGLNKEQQSCRNPSTGAMESEPQCEKSINDKDNIQIDETNLSSNDTGVIGLAGSSLYLCGYSGCSFKAENSSTLKEHFFVCKFAEKAGPLSCTHCERTFRTPANFMDHLPKHGLPRYSCGLCNFRSTHTAIVVRHLRHKHKISSFEKVPVDTLNTDPETEFCIIRPKEIAIKRGKLKTQPHTLIKTSYGPEERDMLPLMAVLTQDVTCKSCNYATKVRSNMMRHLQQHALGCEPSPVPVVNPVPHLERNEKMFDTMTNHAISSTIPVRRDSNAFKVTDEPKFVPENKRYMCCAPTCQQISADDAMLRHHIRVLHPETLVYKCPHCPDPDTDNGKQAIMLEKLGSHLKMHDSRLYSCLSCSYYHYQRHVVERHTSEKHPDQKLIRVVREPMPGGPSDSENVIDIESEIMSATAEGLNTHECGLCSIRGSRGEVVNHVGLVHRIFTQYKCSLCSFRTNNRNRFASHFMKHHPNSNEDFIELVQKIKPDKTSGDSQQISVNLAPPVERSTFNSTPLWHRNAPRIRHVRGILFEENGLKPKELEQNDINFVDMPSSSGLKRSYLGYCEDMQSAKRERKDDKLLSCAKCMRKFSIQKENEYKEHLQMHFSSDSSRFKCVKCQKTFSNYDEVVTHVTVSHGELTSSADIIDTHSEEYINSDISNQLRGLHTPADSVETEFRGSPSHGDQANTLAGNSSDTYHNFSPKKIPLINNKFSSSNHIEGFSASVSPTDLTTSTTSPTRKPRTVKRVPLSPSAGVKAQSQRSESHHGSNRFHSQMSSVVSELETADKQIQPKNLWVGKSDDLEVDESALEMDIEEVEDEEVNVEEISSEESYSVNKSKPSKTIEESSTSISKAEFACKYKESHGCGFVSTSESEAVKHTMRSHLCKYSESHGCRVVSRNKNEASNHEMSHWEVKPWKCGHCSYQAVKQSSIKMHSFQKHPQLNVEIVANQLPPEPKILPSNRQQGKSELPSGAKATPHNPALREDKTLSEMVDNEELFKCLHVYRCGFCRLRETSLSRLLFHWQFSHRNMQSLHEVTPDGRRIVPFKFREVKLGDHEKETMAFRCALCSRSGTIKLLLEHYPSRHPGEKLKISELIHDRVQCSLCPRQFSGKASLTSHFASLHPGEEVGSLKLKTKDNSDTSFENNFGCLYCLEPVKSASEMKDHHMNFHSHLDAKYIELESLESDQQPSAKNSNSGCFLEDINMPSQSETKETHSGRPSVIQCVRRTSIDEHEETPVMKIIDVDSPCSQPTIMKRAVAKKSTSKCRSVARKSTGGRPKNRTCVPLEIVVSSSSDSELSDEESPSHVEDVDVNKISCPMMFGGTRMRVSLATLSQYTNLYPSVELIELNSEGET